MKNNGLIHIYTGDGKGKTTAAIGLAVRAKGAGRKIIFFQFLKAMPTSEQVPMQSLGIEVIRSTSCRQFFFEMDDTQRVQCIREQQDAFYQAKAVLLSSKFDLIVLDEILDAISLGCIREKELIEALEQKNADLEVVLTGRNPSHALCDLADYLSVINGVKHPFYQNREARLGIEY